MRLLLFLILLSSQISAELMSLECEYRIDNSVTAWNKFTFDKNQGATADVETYYFNGTLRDTVVGATLIWSPSSITIKYSSDAGGGLGVDRHSTDIISRENLNYIHTYTIGKLVVENIRLGQCIEVEVTSKKVF